MDRENNHTESKNKQSRYGFQGNLKKSEQTCWPTDLGRSNICCWNTNPDTFRRISQMNNNPFCYFQSTEAVSDCVNENKNHNLEARRDSLKLKNSDLNAKSNEMLSI